MSVPATFPVGKVANYLRLRDLDSEIPLVLVVQGDSVADYHRCADMFERAGIDLAAEPVIGVGSVCRRQHSPAVEQVMRSLAARGLRLHGFGVKTSGLARYADALVSSDSMAWSFRGRHVPGCAPSHRSESNCVHFALAWHHRVTNSLSGQAAAPSRSRERPRSRTNHNLFRVLVLPTPRQDISALNAHFWRHPDARRPTVPASATGVPADGLPGAPAGVAVLLPRCDR
jgi:hypothetical protein